MKSGGRGLYVHIPYCETKCPYCDFVCAASRDLPHPRAFLAALERDLDSSSGPYATIFVGGGTPTALGLPLFRRLLGLLAPRLAPGGEWTVEATPVSTTRSKAEALREAGVTRVSLGVQSIDDASLAHLGRAHRHADTIAAIANLRSQNIENLSVDLIFGLPRRGFEPSLDWAIGEDFPHVSLYDLTIEEGTPFARLPRARATNDRSAGQYRAARARLAAARYRAYEVSNFARDGFSCRHNENVWRGRPYDAAGPGAHAWDGARRTIRRRDIADYIARGGIDPVETIEETTPEIIEVEALLSALRTDRGLAREDWGPVFDRILDRRAGVLAEAAGAGWLVVGPDRVRATERGTIFLDSVLAKIA